MINKVLYLILVAVSMVWGQWTLPVDSVFVMRVKTDNPGTSNSNQFTLGVYTGAGVNYFVEWGDNNVDTITTAANVTYTYATAGEYDVKIQQRSLGNFPQIRFNNEYDCKKVIEIKQWGKNRWGSLNRAFYGCSKMRITATDHSTIVFSTAVTSLNLAFAACSSLTYFPPINFPYVTDSYQAWYACTSLDSFPAGLRMPLNRSCGRSWQYCRSLDSFPPIPMDSIRLAYYAWDSCVSMVKFRGADMPRCTSFSETWDFCHSIDSFPNINVSAGISFNCTWRFDSMMTYFPIKNFANATNMNMTWRVCQRLTRFDSIYTPNVTNFHETWVECSGLTYFSDKIYTGKGTDFEWCWNHCYRLPSLPALDFSAATTVRYMVAACSSMVSFAPTNFPNVTLATGMFQGTTNINNIGVLKFPKMTNGVDMFAVSSTIPSSKYSQMLTYLADSNSNSSVTLNAGSATYYTSVAAKRTALTTRNWTIIDGGEIDDPKKSAGNKKTKIGIFSGFRRRW